MPKGRFLHTSGHQFGSQRMAGKSPILPIFCIAANVWIERSETNEA